MSDLDTKTADDRPAQVPAHKPYGFSALISGLAKMWRGTVPALIAIVVNTVVQAALVYWNAGIGLNAPFIISSIISAGVLVLCFALLARTSLQAVTGRVSLSNAFSETATILPTFALWALVLIVLVMAGFMLFPLLGLVVCWLLAFLAPAAADGQRNAIGANFSALKERWGRWLITSLLLTIGGVIMLLLMALNVFFFTGFAASIIGWLVLGLIAWWLLTTWSAIYRSTRVGGAGAE